MKLSPTSGRKPATWKISVPTWRLILPKRLTHTKSCALKWGKCSNFRPFFPPVNFPVIQDTGRVSTWCAHQQDQPVKEWAYSLAHARTLAITGKFIGGISLGSSGDIIPFVV
jgi:hypothetical protein